MGKQPCAGTKIMHMICDLADHYGITLTLGVANETDDYYTDSDMPSEDDLIDFYSGFGFDVQHGMFDERTRMTRTPA